MSDVIQDTFNKGGIDPRTAPPDQVVTRETKVEPIFKKTQINPEIAPPHMVVNEREQVDWNTAEDVIRQHLINSDNIYEEEDRILGSMYLSKMLNMDYGNVYDNYQEVLESFLGERVAAGNALQAIKDQWDAGWINTRIADIGYKMMTEGKTDFYLKQLEMIKKDMPPIDQQKRSLPISILKAAANTVPFTLESLSKGMEQAGLYAGGFAGVAAMAGQTGPQVASPEEIITVPTAAIMGYGVGLTQGTSNRMLQLEAGLQYVDIMEMEKEYGVDVPEDVAFSISAGVGLLNAAIEVMQIERIPGVKEGLRAITSKGIRDITLKGGFREIAKKAFTRYATSTAENVAQEMLQETVNVVGTELAKLKVNKDAGKIVAPYATAWNYLDRMIETAKQSAAAFSVMGIPGTVGIINQDVKQRKNLAKKLIEKGIKPEEYNAYVSKINEEQELDTKNLVSESKALEKTDDSQVRDSSGELIKVYKTESDLPGLVFEEKVDRVSTEEFNKSDTKKALETTIPRNISDQIINSLLGEEVSLTKDEINKFEKTSNLSFDGVVDVYDWLQNDNPLTTEGMNVAQQLGVAPGKVTGYYLDAQKILTTADRDQIVEARNNYDAVQLRTEKGTQWIVFEAEKAIPVEKREITKTRLPIRKQSLIQTQQRKTRQKIQTYEQQLEISDPEKVADIKKQIDVEKKYLQFLGKRETALEEGKEYWQMTRAEYNRRKARGIQTITEEAEILSRDRFKNLIQTRTDLRDNEVEAVMSLADLRAQAMGMTTDQWAEQFIAGIENADIPGKAAVKFLDDGRAIIMLSEKSDFTSWVHELGHIIRRQLILDDAEKAALEKWAGAEEGWTRAAEEKFTEGFEQYLRKGEAPTGLASIFQKIADLLNKLLGKLKDVIVIPDNIQKIFDSVFVARQLTLPDVAAQEDVLFQSEEHEALVKDAVEKGYPVPDEVLEEYSNREWAAKEIAIRQEEHKISWMYEIANGFDNEQLFINHLQEVYEDILPEDPEERARGEQRLKDIYKRAKRKIPAERTANNLNFINSFSPGAAVQFLGDLSLNKDKMKGSLVPFPVFAIADKVAKTSSLSDSNYQFLLNLVEKNPVKYREIIAYLYDDYAELQKIEDEQFFVDAEKALTEIQRVEMQERLKVAREARTEQEREAILNGTISMNDIVEDNKRLAKELKISRSKQTQTSNKLKEWKYHARKMENFLSDTENQLKEAQNKLEKIEKQIGKLEKENKEVSDALKSAREESRLQVKKLKEEYTKAAKEQKKRYSTEIKERLEAELKKERDRVHKIYKDRATKKKIKDYALKLAKNITAKVPSTVKYEYAEKIRDIQKTIDPKFRSQKTLDRIDTYKKWAEDEDFKSLMTDRLLKTIKKKPLNEFSIKQLENIANEVESLRKFGRINKQIIDAQRKAEERKDMNTVIMAATKGKGVVAETDIKIGADEYKKGALEKIRRTRYSTLNAPRLFDMIDGKKAFNGPVHRMFVDRINKAVDNEYRHMDRRYADANKKIKELGIKVKDFAKTKTIDGVEVSNDWMMEVYAGWKNDAKREVLIHAHNVNEIRYAKIINALDQKYKDFADWIINEYEKESTRLREAHIEMTNEDFGYEENYTPIYRQEVFSTAVADEIAEDIAMRSAIRTGNVDKRFAINRQKISAGKQGMMRMGLFSNWMYSVPRHEHYVNSAKTLNRLTKVATDKYVQMAIRQKYGDSMNIEVQNYLKHVTDPSLYQKMPIHYQWADRLRRNVGIAFLSFNPVTMLKQFPSLAYYLADAPIHYMMSSIGKFAIDPVGFIKQVEEIAPQIKHRSIDMIMEELKAANRRGYEKIKAQIGRVGFKGIEIMDKMVVSIGFDAVYRSKIKDLGHDEAVRRARNAFLRSQPTAHAKDLPSLYRTGGPFVKWFLQFSRQLNQIYNMATYDLPSYVKNMNYLKALGSGAGLYAGALLIWMIVNRKPPKDEKDYLAAVSDSAISSIPVFGGAIYAAKQDYDTEIPIYIIPRFIGEVMKYNEKFDKITGYSNKKRKRFMENVLLDLYQAIATGIGIPYTEGKRAVRGLKAAENGGFPELLQHLFLGGEWDKEEE